MPRLPRSTGPLTIDPMDLGAAVRRARADRLKQGELAAAIGVTQPTMSEIETGKRPPTIDELVRIEQACDRPPGWVLSACGYGPSADGVLAALEADPELTDEGRELLAVTYEAARARGRAQALRR